MYSIQIKDRNYSEWDSTPSKPFQSCPTNYKLFDGDVFDFDHSFNLIDSPLRSNQNIPGVLLLENNRSFGRTNNGKRLLYKCKPFHIGYPYFLIPYEIPMRFNKNFRNKYVTFRFDSWEGKHPRGILSQTIGDVDDLPSFYDYQLFCRNLHQPITKLLKQCKEKSKENNHLQWIQYIISNSKKFGKIEIEEGQSNIFSIDPEDCTDRDDAISICKQQHRTTVTVYIANVWIWIEAFDLWSLIGNRISTIYLPDRKRSMLPSIITEDYCSLDSGKQCFVIAMDFVIDNGHVSFTEPVQKLVTINKHYSYDDKKLYKDKCFQELEYVTKQLDKSIQDSHDIVSFWMTKMNVTMASLLKKKECGIFRIASCKQVTPSHTHVPDYIKQFIRLWEQKISGSYVVYNSDQSLIHDIMGTDQYIHFTSPIRRMVDLVNHLYWVSNTHVVLSDKANVFIQQFQYNIQNVNEIMSKIKKVQNDCSILSTVSINDQLLNQIYSATVIQNLGENMFMIYIQELKWVTKTYSLEDLGMFHVVQCKLYIYIKEEQFRRKVRVQII